MGQLTQEWLGANRSPQAEQQGASGSPEAVLWPQKVGYTIALQMGVLIGYPRPVAKRPEV